MSNNKLSMKYIVYTYNNDNNVVVFLNYIVI